MPEEKYPALRYLLTADVGRLFPEERRELVGLLGRLERLEKVNEAAEAVADAS